MNKQVVISFKTILLTFGIILAGYVIYRLGPVIGILAIAILLTIAMESVVNYLMRLTVFNKPLRRGVAVLISYGLLLLITAIIGTVGLPPVISQFQKMISGISQIAQELNLGDGFSLQLKDFLPQAANVSSELLSVTISVFSNVTTIFSIFVLAIYMSLDWKNLKKKFFSLFPEHLEDEAEDTFLEVERNVGQWLKGQFILMLVIGTASFVGLLLLDVRYPLALAMVAGLLEIVPMIGPVLSAVIAAIIGFSDTPLKGVGVVALFIVIQQLENNLLVPKIMQKVSGFSPLVILLALLIGSEFFGVVGAIIAIPTTMILSILLKRILAHSE
jgi:predicted PurR-regulated permease PerM